MHDETPAIPPAQSLARLKARALGLLSRREHTRRELERKLEPHEQLPGQLTQALDDLQAKGYLDDARAAASYVHRRAAGWGEARLRREMSALGLAREEIERALEGLEQDELARAHAAWLRKYRVPAADPRERARQARFLLARGFGADVVRRVVAGLGAQALE